MATRLDRLFVLLDTGSTPVVRKTAAEQLGQVQKLHPHELNNLLTKVHFYLGSSTWESRIAAAQAVDAICRNVPQWEPRYDNTDSDPSPIITQGRMSLSQFDVLQVLMTGAALCGSEGTEYDTIEETGLINPERLAQQKQMLNKRLGLDVAGGLGVGTELYTEEDLILNRDESRMDTQPAGSSVKDLLSKQLSARERNRAKRKAKRIIRQGSNEPENVKNGGNSSDGTNKLRKTASVMVEQPDTDKVLLDSVPDNTLNTEDLDEWPFETFCDQLTSDLFHPSWEKRHGAATALREVIKSHGAGAGKMPDMSASQMQASNQLWLEDTALRLICVLALDRFGDFVSDEVVAPVRETCAQTLGAVLHLMDSLGVQSVVKVLLQLLCQQQWEVRHGSLLAFKYLLAVRQDLSSGLLPTVVPSVLPGLMDQDDDVRAVAAAALLPVADSLVRTLPNMVTEILRFLWHILNDLDDLTASTGSVMNLLSSLLANSSLPQNCISVTELPALVPRLYPFLSHNIMTVRQAALDTFITLVVKYNIPGENMWILHVLPESLRHVYQRCLLEEKQQLLDIIYKLWLCLLSNITPLHIIQATSQWMGVWLSLMMQPSRLAFDGNLLTHAKYAAREMTPSRSRHLALHGPREHKDTKYFIGGSQSFGESAQKRDQTVIKARVMAARLLGCLLSKVVVNDPSIPQNIESPQDALGKLLAYHLTTKSALQRMSVALVIIEWTKQQQPCRCPEFLKAQLHHCLTEPVYYDEIALAFTRTQSECRDFIAGLKVNGINMDTFYAPGSVLTLEQATALCTTVYDSVKDKLKGKAAEMCDDRRRCLQQTVEQTTLEQQVLNNRVQSSLAGALTLLQSFPEKLNPVIRPLMETAKKEENSQLQMCSACSLSRLLHFCVSRDPCPNPKVIKNLITLLCSDPLFTPQVAMESPGGVEGGGSGKVTVVTDKQQGILTLWSQNQSCDIGHTGRGRKPNWVKSSVPKTLEVSVDLVIEEHDQVRKQILTGRRGATLYLTQIVRDFAETLPEAMSPLWTTMTEPLVAGNEKLNFENDNEAQELVNALQVLEVTGSAICQRLHKKLLDLLPSLLCYLQHSYTAVRHITARCLAMLTRLDTMTTMEFLLDHVLPLLGASEDDVKRQGGIEAVANVIEHLGLEIIAYIVLIIVPVLGRMSDQNDSVRLMATHCFATLIKLLPLEAGIPDPPSMKASLVQRKEQERRFLEQLLDGSKVENYKVPVPIKAELRKYQQDGVNWMAFLNKYKLHGILCDDMGLGKTLQSLCILAGDHWNRKLTYTETKSADSSPLTSIVVCPPTLTGHWVYEVEKFIDKEHLNPLHYTGPPAERIRLQKRIKKHNLVIASYDVVRNDVDFFSGIYWNYCILDEGHIIKNSKTKISKSVKQLNCNHRMILSGTPIQNNVLELWSLFDFLMPGFLGTEKQFQARYGRPILLSRDAKSSSKEQEAGALAMEALHRQVLPFLLRRMKEDVLQDLPPKIIQDYYCDLSPLQVQLYEDFAKSQAKKSVEDDVTEFDDQKTKANVKSANHIFQALQYLRKLCNHPALVLNPSHPEYSNVMKQLKQQGSKLRELQHAPKLTALRQLLLDCGIGVSDTSSDQAPVVNQHRVLLFCQLKSMLDIVENDLLKSELKSVTYLRLDGSVPAGNRISIVNRFNNDPSIDMLLLTTHVGGLGLNLTGADTVIFVEHDWNPMKDLQAMDRAHRIGQKKVVNVYRLITRGTLEEKIMGLQKFKLNIANTVITQDNSSLTSMATDQLLDLFSLDEKQKAQSAAGKTDQSGDATHKHGMKSVLENLEELWDEKQYEDEYDLSNFMKGLSK